MSDFIYSCKITAQKEIERAFRSVYKEDLQGVDYFNADGSMFAFSKNIYNGFAKYETDKYVCIVLGGPVLNFGNNNFITQKDSNEGTKSIYQRWIIEDEIVWHHDLDGPFVVALFNKLSGCLNVVTDMLSFIPVFKSQGGAIGTHLNIIRDIEDCSPDEVSVADFLINDVVTFPYTIFNGVNQIFPASEHCFSGVKDNQNHRYENYWLPKENTGEDVSLDALKIRLRKGIKSYVDRIVEANPIIGVLLSGGEDSRAVLGMIPQTTEKSCFIYSQNDNKEVKIARKVAKNNGTKLIRSCIGENYIKDTFQDRADLVGIGNDCAHSHSFGFNKELKFNSYDAIFGGFLADSFLKALYVAEPNKKLSFVNDEVRRFFPSEIILKVKSRNSTHLYNLEKIRPKAFTEWYGLFPISMNKHLPNIGGHRRIIRNFEPFTCSEVIKIAAIAPQKIKLNRILFQGAMKPFFKSTKWILHNSGHLPYFSYKFNYYWKIIYRLTNKIFRKLSGKLSKGTWFNWKNFLNSSEGAILYNKYVPALKKQFPELFKNINREIFDYELSDTQRRNLLQLGYHFSKK